MSAPRTLFRFLGASPLLTRSSLQSQVSRNIARNVRTQSTAATAEGQTAAVSYWNSPVGPKTVHFWAPVMKWSIVLAGIADFARPAEQLSLNTNAALIATGLIWTRWCFVIKPRNVLLAAVNFFMFCVGSVQTARILQYRSSLKHESLGDAAKELVKEQGDSLKATVTDPKGAVKP